ncbi:MAG: TonB-dependent hemoglobin/transferrin/lactoferrin family receptor [Cyanothece sp. SIO2G6]|nr:TonB-dependent hemoglobin/transferrin/lactoferrin family receptor [Cyanothece sp. SIO2G6]
MAIATSFTSLLSASPSLANDIPTVAASDTEVAGANDLPSGEASCDRTEAVSSLPSDETAIASREAISDLPSSQVACDGEETTSDSQRPVALQIAQFVDTPQIAQFVDLGATDGSKQTTSDPDEEPEAVEPEAVESDVLTTDEFGNIRITVTGTRTPRTIQLSPATITVFDADDIDRRLLRDIRDLVQYEPGVSVRNNLQYGLQGFNIRGIEGNRVLIQVDGIRLPSALQSGNEVVVGQGFNLGRDFFDTEILQTAEIIRGPASALYGSDALGGAVSFFTLDPGTFLDAAGRDIAGVISTNFDSQNEAFTHTVIQASRFDDFEYLLAFTRRDSSENENLGDSQDNDRNNFLGRFVYNLTDTQSLDFTAEVFDNNSDLTVSDDNLELITGTTTGYNEDIKTNRTRFSLAYEYDDDDSLSFLNYARAQFYFQDSRIREVSERELISFNFQTQTSFPAVRDSENRFTDRVFGGSTQFRSDFDVGPTAHRLTYGFDISNTFNARPRDRVQTNLITGETTRDTIPDNFPLKDFPDSDTFRVGVYVQDEIEFGNGRWSLIPGVRFDYYDLNIDSDEDFERNGATAAEFNDDALSPNVALVFAATPEISIYGRYSRGFRAPLYDEVNSGFTNFLFGYRTLPNPNLDAETSDSFELGVRGDFEQFDFGVVGFYNNYDDFIEFQQVGTEPIEGRDFLVFQNVNVDSAEIYGVEASAEYRFSPGTEGFSVFGNLAWTIGNNLTDDEPLATVDPIEGIVGLRYRAPADQWGVELLTTLVGTARGEGFDPGPEQDPFVPNGFTVVDLIGYVQVNPDLVFNLGLYNLFDNDYVRYADVRALNRNEELFDRRRDRFRQPGFNIRAGLTWDL